VNEDSLEESIAQEEEKVETEVLGNNACDSSSQEDDNTS